ALVAAGKGTLRIVDRGVKEMPDEQGLARIAALLAGDWALLKDTRPGPFACLKARRDGLRKNEKVWQLGYPGPAYRPAGGYSIGFGAYGTFGEALVDFEDVPAWGDLPEGKPRDVLRRIFHPSMSTGDYFFTTADCKGGMSGGPVLDAEGRHAGVASRGADSAFVFVNGASNAVSARKISKDLELLGLDAAAVFDCP